MPTARLRDKQGSMKKSPYDHVFEVQTIGEHTAKPIKITRCKVCGGVPEKNLGNGMTMEKSLATHCPGQPLTREQLGGIGDTLDFRDGAWVALKPTAP